MHTLTPTTRHAVLCALTLGTLSVRGGGHAGPEGLVTIALLNPQSIIDVAARKAEAQDVAAARRGDLDSLAFDRRPADYRAARAAVRAAEAALDDAAAAALSGDAFYGSHPQITGIARQIVEIKRDLERVGQVGHGYDSALVAQAALDEAIARGMLAT